MSYRQDSGYLMHLKVHCDLKTYATLNQCDPDYCKSQFIILHACLNYIM